MPGSGFLRSVEVHRIRPLSAPSGAGYGGAPSGESDFDFQALLQLQQGRCHKRCHHPPPFPVARPLQALPFRPRTGLPRFVVCFDAPAQFISAPRAAQPLKRRWAPRRASATGAPTACTSTAGVNRLFSEPPRRCGAGRASRSVSPATRRGRCALYGPRAGVAVRVYSPSAVRSPALRTAVRCGSGRGGRHWRA